MGVGRDAEAEGAGGGRILMPNAQIQKGGNSLRIVNRI